MEQCINIQPLDSTIILVIWMTPITLAFNYISFQKTAHLQIIEPR